MPAVSRCLGRYHSAARAVPHLIVGRLDPIPHPNRLSPRMDGGNPTVEEYSPMRLTRTAVAATLTLFAITAGAEPAAIVESLQLPAWLHHGGARQPLLPGAALESSDVIETGSGARVQLRLAEGSTVKLGESASLTLEKLEPAPAADGVFTGLLNVARGAFRFTTTALGANRRRDINARIATATIGIRGTDVWGKAEAARDFVVLLEGKIEVTRDQQTVSMSEPMSLYMAPRGQAAEPLRPVDPNDLARWAQETELQAGGGILTHDGAWQVHLASVKEEDAAREFSRRLADDGYPTQIARADVNGRPWYRVGTPGFLSRAEAEAYARALTGRFGITSPWVMHR
jgi:hypothetical protein